MRALTIQQPYSHLIVHQQSELPEGTFQKRVENRVRRTHIRGMIAIHAGVSMAWFKHGDWPVLAKHPDEVLGITFGAIVGLADIVECIDFENVATDHAWVATHKHSSGPFCYVLDNVSRLQTPVPCKGAQGFWTVPPQIETMVLASPLIEVPFEGVNDDRRSDKR